MTHQNGLLFSSGKRHIPKQIMETVEVFDEKYNNNGKPWKSSKILRLKPNFFIFSLFIIFLHFSCLNCFKDFL